MPSFSSLKTRSVPQLVPGGPMEQAVPKNANVSKNIPVAVTQKRGAVSVRLDTTVCYVRKNAIQASLAPTVSSHVIVQVEGHVTLKPESAAKDVLLGFRGTSVNWPAKQETMVKTVV
ncbi:hypothetical protein AMECASPLE_027952 [Ameca splendens]|uniref:Uncharacterized protein n=1 Tax=Ameca splendens TaxID=208324 RepID=A0ABV1ACS8_9TELE